MQRKQNIGAVNGGSIYRDYMRFKGGQCNEI